LKRRDFLTRALALPLGAGLLRTVAAAQTPAGEAAMKGPVKYVGVWRNDLGTGAQWSIPASDWNAFAAADQAHFAAGRRLTTLSTYHDHDANAIRYVATWRSGLGTPAQYTIPAGTWDQFWAAHQEHYGKQRRLVAVSVTNRSGQLAYTGTWRGGVAGSQHVGAAKKWDAFAAEAKQYGDQGARIVTASAATAPDGSAVYMAVWSPAQGAPVEHIAPIAAWGPFVAQGTAYFNQGLRLAAFAATDYHGLARYFGVWRGGMGTAGQYTSPPAEWSSFAATNQGYFNQGYRLSALSVMRDQNVAID
jgi:hypothetical protein